jgi:glycine cleavage system H protein
MFLVLAVLTFALLIGISYLSGLKKKGLLSGAVVEGPAIRQPIVHSIEMIDAEVPRVTVLPGSGKDTRRVEGYALPESLYYHQGHTWVAVQDSGIVVVGMDEFAGSLLGKPTSVSLPRIGEMCRQGALALTLRRNDKALDLLSPVDGQVIAINGRVIDDPGVVTHEPYGNGWLMMIKPRELRRNLRNLIAGPVARGWMEESAGLLRSMFSGNLGLVFQDGGLPESGMSENFGAMEWRELTNRMFMIEPDGSGSSV